MQNDDGGSFTYHHYKDELKKVAENFLSQLKEKQQKSDHQSKK